MKNLVLALTFFITSVVFAQNDFEGYWMMPKGKFIIQIKKQKNNEYVGYVAWLKDLYYPKGDNMEGIEQFDRNNPNKKLRLENRKVLGLQVVGALYENQGKLKGGWIYDSWNGKLYHGSAKLLNKNTLNLRGSFDKWGILGLSQKSKRVIDLKKYGFENQ